MESRTATRPPSNGAISTQLSEYGRSPRSSATGPTTALDALPAAEGKQRVVVFDDLAAVEAARKHPNEACVYAQQAMDQFTMTWYATGMERIRDVRQAVQPWADSDAVRELDDRLYGWQTTLSALQR